MNDEINNIHKVLKIEGENPENLAVAEQETRRKAKTRTVLYLSFLAVTIALALVEGRVSYSQANNAGMTLEATKAQVINKTVAQIKDTSQFICHQNAVSTVSFSPDGKILASGSYDKTIKLWDVATGKKITTLQGHYEAVQTLSFSRDGKTLVSGSWDGTIIFWSFDPEKLRVNGCNWI